VFTIHLDIQKKKIIFQINRKMNLISLYKEEKKERKKKRYIFEEALRYKVYCQSSQRHTHREKEKKNFRVLKTRAQITYHLTVVNQIKKKKNIFNEIDDTDIFRESIQKKENANTHVKFHREKKFTKKKNQERKKDLFSREIHLT